MYKSSFLWHLSRVGRQHPFFTQNVNGANSTALSLVQPKLGLAAERSYFSSWGPNGHSASNAGPVTNSQSVLIALSNDDNQQWERDLRLHRKQFRSIAGIRRYSTGAQTATEQIQSQNVLHLTAEEPEVTAEESSTKSTDVPSVDAVDAVHTDHNAAAASEFSATLEKLYAQREYVPLLQHISAGLQTEKLSLSLNDYQLLFRSLNRVKGDFGAHPAFDVIAFYGDPATMLNFYKGMLETGVTPDDSIYDEIMLFLSNSLSDSIFQGKLLEKSKFVKNTPQEAFFSKVEGRLEQNEHYDILTIAFEIFQASNSIKPVKYSSKVLENLLSICAHYGSIDNAIGIFDHYDKIGVPKSANVYRHLLRTFAKVGDLKGAIACYSSWKDEYRQLPKHNFFLIYEAMLTCYFAAGNYSGARHFFQVAEQRTRGPIESRFFETMACQYAKYGLFKEGLAFLHEYSKKRELNMSRALGLMNLEACLLDQPDMATLYYTEARSFSDFATSTGAVWVYLDMLTSEGQIDEAVTLVERCIRHQCEVKLSNMSFLITKCLEAGNTTDVFKLVRYVITRRAIKAPSEMNRNKCSTFIKILLDDLKRLNLLDATSSMLMLEVLAKLGRASNSQVAMDFVQGFIKLLSPNEMLSVPVDFNNYCTVVLRFMPRSVNEDFQPEISMNSEHIQNHLEWMKQTLKLLKEASLLGSLNSFIVPAASDSAQTAGLQQLSVELEKCDSEKADSRLGLAHLPTDRVVFLEVGHPKINNFLSAEAARTINIGEKYKAERSASRTYQQLIQAVEQAEAQDTYIEGTVLLKIIEFLGRNHLDNELLKMIALFEKNLPQLVRTTEYLPGARALLYDTVLRAYNDLLDDQSAQKYHDLILDLGYVPSADSYASFIAKMDETRHRDGATRALALFNEAKDLGVQPTSYLFNTVIAKLAKARRNDEALALFEEMKAVGLPATGVTYGTVINSCCRVGQTETAEALLTEMEMTCAYQNKVAPYNTLIQHFVQVKKDRAKAFYYWDKLRSKAIAPTSHSFRLLIEAHGHLEPINRKAAEDVIQQMQYDRRRVDTIHHASLIVMYGVKLNELQTATDYFRYWTSGPRPRIRPDDIIFQAIIECAVHAKDVTLMESLIDELRDLGIPLNAYIVGFAIRGFSEAGLLHRARALFDELPTSGPGSMAKEPSTYEAMIRAYNTASQAQKNDDILEMMKAQKYPGTILQHASTLVSSQATF